MNNTLIRIIREFRSDIKGFKSSNPVVRDDGKFFVFQASEASSDAGVGCGLYLFDSYPGWMAVL